MADQKEHVKPLASISHQLHSDDRVVLPPPAKLHRKHKYIKCCGCFAALLLILAVIGIILGFTVFHIKTPDFRIDSLTLSGGGFPSGDIILVAAVSVKNPNVVSFKYAEATTKIYYGGEVIGEGETPAGEAAARKTTTMNVTVEIKEEKEAEVPDLVEDFVAGALNISTYSEIPGKVRIIGLIKKDLVVQLNCSITYNSKSQMIQEEDCSQSVEFSD